MKRAKSVALLLSVAVAFLAGMLCVPRQVRSEFLFNDYDMARQLDIVIGESKVVEVANPKRIAIGDPKIADVVGASRTEILVSAKAAGETNLQIWDDYGQREVLVRVFEEDLGRLKKRLEDLFATAGLRSVYFQVGEQERKVFVLGEVPLRKKDVVTQLLESFRNRIIDLVTFKEDNPLVEIDVQVMEIAKTAIDKLGINWSQSLVFNEQPTPAPHTLIRQAADLIKAVGQSQFDRTALTATLNILEQDNLARTLARPKLVALSGKEAKILVGGSVPILSSVSVSSGTTTTAVDYVEYGIKLNIKPEVKETGDIQCSLEVEIKTIDSSTQLTVQTGQSISTTTPGFKTRNVTSELYLKNNETIFLAGLIDNEQTNNLQQVPGLGNLPIFGALFRSKNFQVGDTELVVSLTPKVVRYGDMLQDVESASKGKAAPEEEPADAYVRTIQETILKNVSYPVEAQRANLSGEVVLSLHLLSSGQLVGVMVSQSSGHKLLDKAAVYTVKRLAPYPAFPKGLLLKEIWVEVPIAYQMN
ncbi:MAG: TonB family protein [Candidatus Velamenicoccus archaeovorus]